MGEKITSTLPALDRKLEKLWGLVNQNVPKIAAFLPGAADFHGFFRAKTLQYLRSGLAAVGCLSFWSKSALFGSCAEFIPGES
jgi:hypothetical protein